MKKILLILFNAFIFSLFFISCGLPSYNVVKAPIVGDPDYQVYKSFTAPSDVNIDGYEIYYKIYQFEDSKILSDEQEYDISGTSYLYEFGKVKPERLGFIRLMRLDSGLSTNIAPGIPFIQSGTDTDELDPGEEFRIALDSIELESVNNGVPLRSATDVDGYFKKFSEEIISTDNDSNNVIPDDTFVVSFVAYSYVSSIITNYQDSYPVFLGTFTGLSN